MDCAGTVGKAVAQTEMKIAEDGEILTRGRHVFVGYFKDPAATAQVLEDGWLHTGDLGEKDSRGFVRIRGRKKEILKTSGGKMVAPLPIEEALKAAPIISQVCMVGDGKKFLSALITLSETKLSELSKSNGTLSGRTITSPPVLKEVKTFIDELNTSLASYEQIKKFAILSKEFSIVEGEMTPTLKMKRNVIEKKYQDVINQFYE
jgi:long-chain acyl-CoA synthetase